MTNGTLDELVRQAREQFPLVGDAFSVARQLIDKWKKSGRLTIWHPGTESPVLPVEPILSEMITQARVSRRPLSVGQCKDMMNEMISRTLMEAEIIGSRVANDTYVAGNPTLGNG